MTISGPIIGSSYNACIATTLRGMLSFIALGYFVVSGVGRGILAYSPPMRYMISTVPLRWTSTSFSNDAINTYQSARNFKARGHSNRHSWVLHTETKSVCINAIYRRTEGNQLKTQLTWLLDKWRSSSVVDSCLGNITMTPRPARSFWGSGWTQPFRSHLLSSSFKSSCVIGCFVKRSITKHEWASAAFEPNEKVHDKIVCRDFICWDSAATTCNSIRHT